MLETVHFIQSFSNLMVFLVITGGLVILTIFLPLIRHKLGFTLSKEINDGASDAFKAVCGSTIFVLAFSLYQVQSNFQAAETLVQHEADTINNLDRILARFGQPQADSLRGPLYQYASVVVSDEWPLLQQDQSSPKADALLKAFADGGRNLSPVTPRQQSQYGDLTKLIDTLTDLRRARLGMTSTELPMLYWTTIGGLLALLLFLSLATHSTPDKRLSHGGSICSAGLLLSLIIIIDDPFKGTTCVQPTAFITTMQLMQSR
jgi:hypothetical protein